MSGLAAVSAGLTGTNGRSRPLAKGGLLLVRKSLFNQSAGLSATQTDNAPQLVTGKIDVIDPDGDDWSIEVVENPSHGTSGTGRSKFVVRSARHLPRKPVRNNPAWQAC